MSQFDSRETVLKLDLCGQVQREEHRETVRKQQSVAEYRAGFDSAFAEGHRKIDLRKLSENDPATAFFLVANRNFDSA